MSLSTAIAVCTWGYGLPKGRAGLSPVPGTLPDPKGQLHTELGPEPRVQKDKTKAGTAGSPTRTGVPRMRSRPGRAAVKGRLHGQISELILQPPPRGPAL